MVYLRFYEDLPPTEIARRLGEPAGTVRWRLKSALDEMRVQLDARHGGDRDRWRALLLPLASRVASQGTGGSGAAAPAATAGNGLLGATAATTPGTQSFLWWTAALTLTAVTLLFLAVSVWRREPHLDATGPAW